jgi:hypothetical protein
MFSKLKNLKHDVIINVLVGNHLTSIQNKFEYFYSENVNHHAEERYCLIHAPFKK